MLDQHDLMTISVFNFLENMIHVLSVVSYSNNTILSLYLHVSMKIATTAEEMNDSR